MGSSDSFSSYSREIKKKQFFKKKLIIFTSGDASTEKIEINVVVKITHMFLRLMPFI